MIRCVLGENMTNCPRSWQNFIYHIQCVTSQRDQGISTKEINDHLKEYQGIFIDFGSTTFGTIEFTEAGYMLFLVKFGGPSKNWWSRG